MKFQDVMVDLETLGTAPGSAILSIGAVFFDPETGALGAQFHEKITLASCEAAGLRMDAPTVLWWMEQSSEARQTVFFDGNAIPLQPVLVHFSTFLSTADGGLEKVRIWGNGAAFDNVLLREAYLAEGMIPPWNHWNDRCYRTLKNLRPDVKMERSGTHHDALDDAVSQARHACAIFSVLRQEARDGAMYRKGFEEGPPEGGVGLTDKSRPLERAARAAAEFNALSGYADE